jgi:ADP-ribosylation factor-like protein 3
MPTQGFNVKTLSVGNFKFNFSDPGGQKAIRQHWKNYYDKLDCIIYVIDSSDRIRMEECAEELQALLEEDKLAGVPLLIYAIK